MTRAFVPLVLIAMPAQHGGIGILVARLVEHLSRGGEIKAGAMAA